MKYREAWNAEGQLGELYKVSCLKKETESLNSMYLLLECLRAFVNVKCLVAQNAEH